MFCATYPPPPGSAPGYHDAHHDTPRSVANVITGRTQAASTDGGQTERMASAEPKRTSGGVNAGWAEPIRVFSASIPPTASTDTTASTIAPPISKRYWKPFAEATPQ